MLRRAGIDTSKRQRVARASTTWRRVGGHGLSCSLREQVLVKGWPLMLRLMPYFWRARARWRSVWRNLFDTTAHHWDLTLRVCTINHISGSNQAGASCLPGSGIVLIKCGQTQMLHQSVQDVQCTADSCMLVCWMATLLEEGEDLNGAPASAYAYPNLMNIRLPRQRLRGLH